MYPKIKAFLCLIWNWAAHCEFFELYIPKAEFGVKKN